MRTLHASLLGLRGSFYAGPASTTRKAAAVTNTRTSDAKQDRNTARVDADVHSATVGPATRHEGPDSFVVRLAASPATKRICPRVLRTTMHCKGLTVGDGNVLQRADDDSVSASVCLHVLEESPTQPLVNALLGVYQTSGVSACRQHAHAGLTQTQRVFQFSPPPFDEALVQGPCWVLFTSLAEDVAYTCPPSVFLGLRQALMMSHGWFYRPPRRDRMGFADIMNATSGDSASSQKVQRLYKSAKRVLHTAMPDYRSFAEKRITARRRQRKRSRTAKSKSKSKSKSNSKTTTRAPGRRPARKRPAPRRTDTEDNDNDTDTDNDNTDNDNTDNDTDTQSTVVPPSEAEAEGEAEGDTTLESDTNLEEEDDGTRSVASVSKDADVDDSADSDADDNDDDNDVDVDADADDDADSDSDSDDSDSARAQIRRRAPNTTAPQASEDSEKKVNRTTSQPAKFE